MAGVLGLSTAVDYLENILVDAVLKLMNRN